MGSHLASAKNHHFFFLGMGFREFWRRRGAGRGEAKLLGTARAGELLGRGESAAAPRIEEGRPRLEGHVLCRVALQDCHLYRWQGVSRHIEAA